MQNLRFFCLSLALLAVAVSACSTGVSTTAPSTITPQPSETAVPTSTFIPSPTPPISIDRAVCESIQETYHLGDGALNMLVYSPDGHWLAAATTAGAVLYDAASLEEVWSVKTEANLKQIAFTPDSKTLSGVDTQVDLYTWQVEDGSQTIKKTPQDLDELPMVFSLSPDGTTLAVPYYDDSIHLYQTGDGSLKDKIDQFLSIGEFIHQIAYSPDGSSLATRSLNGEIRIWSIAQKRVSYTLQDQDGKNPVGMVFSPDGKTLAVNYETRSGEKSVRMLDVASGKWQTTLEGEVLFFSPNNLILGTSGENITLRDPRSGSVVGSLSGVDLTSRMYALSPDGAFLAAGADDGIHVRRWEEDAGEKMVQGENTFYTALALSAGDDLFAAGRLGGVEIRQLQDGQLVQTLAADDDSVPLAAIAYSPAGDLVAGFSETTVYVWDVESGSLLWSQDTGHSLNDLALSPDGMTLAAAYNEKISSVKDITGVASQILVWNARDGGQLVEFQGPEQILYPGYESVLFSPDGRYLLAVEGGGDIDVWSFDTNELEYTLSNEDSFMSWDPVLAVSPDNEHFASGAMDRQIVLWKFGKSSPFRKMNARDASITALSYSGSGDAIAAGVGHEIRLWNADIGSFLCSIQGSGDTVRKIAFTRNGLQFVSLADDGIIRVWEAGQ